jgi:hypothetical protein
MWWCGYCNNKFTTEKDAEDHENTCDRKKQTKAEQKKAEQKIINNAEMKRMLAMNTININTTA